MKIDKLGVYETRGGWVVEVTNVPTEEEWEKEKGDRINPHYPIDALDRDGLSTTYSCTGDWTFSGDSDDDLVRYLSIEEYPELYI